jgi:hypothetical protein
MSLSFYVDSCIYLNLWQKEGDENFGKPYWEIAKEFFEKVENKKSVIYYSGFILKELKYILTEVEYHKKREVFNSNSCFMKESLTKEEYEEARKIEDEINGEIGFYDIMHILISRKTNSILITRDKKLIEVSNRLGVKAKKPEEIL